MGPSVPPFGPTRNRTPTRRSISVAISVVIALLAAACSADQAGSGALTASTLVDDPVIAADSETAAEMQAAVTPEGPEGAAPGPRPEWLGRRTLPTRPDGIVVAQTTPEELRERRLVTVDRLAPPPGDRFEGSLGAVGDEVLARSTWVEGCPVEPEDLAYLTISFWGFDGGVHTGEMIVHREVATEIVDVFAKLFAARFPLEEMRIVSPADLDAAPTGDGNNTTAFVCRPVTGGTTFSEHAYGLAIDINPFHNPYRRDDLVLPELAGHYLDRSLGQPGMITDGDVVVEAFAAIGWSWGGNWRSLEDYQHFSRSGR